MSKKNSDVFSEVIVGIFMVAVIALLGYFTIIISAPSAISSASSFMASRRLAGSIWY